MTIDSAVRQEIVDLSNWGRWGSDDRLGTLNLLTPSKRASALRLAYSGESLSLSHTIDPEPGRDTLTTGEWFDAAYSQLVRTPQEVTELIGMVFHGVRITHVDAPGHVPFEGLTYPGVRVTVGSGRLEVGDVTPLAGGVVGQGLLVDISGQAGTDHLPDRREITADDLDAALERTGDQVEAGDIILVRTGNAVRIASGSSWDSPPGPGLSVARWLRAHDAAMFGSDTPNEGLPEHPVFGYRFHVATLSMMGLWLMDNLDLDALASMCAARAGWRFLFVMGTPALRGTSGAPVNPLAIL